MNLFTSTFIVLSLIVLASTSNLDPSLQECIDEDSLEALTACSPFVTRLTAETIKYKATRPEPEDAANLSVLCDNTTDCVRKLKCTKLNAKRVFFEEACNGLQFMHFDVLTCLQDFHKALYHQKYECSKSIDFETNDLTKRREAFNSGKACFMEIVKNECSSKSLTYFETKYEHFVDLKTTRPAECEGKHHDLEALKCLHLGKEFQEKKDVLSEGLPVNHTKVLRVIELCEQVVNCDACKLEASKEPYREICKSMRMVNSEAGVCVRKMVGMTLDDEKYRCLRKDVKCVKSEENVKCAKDAMKEYCGQSAADDFERNLDTIMVMIGC